MGRLPIWMRPPAAGTGRPAEWSRRQITAAAVSVADAEGLAAVTMRRVAAELGTGAASLYRHLDTRDDLLDLMIDDALREYVSPPVTGDWRADVVAEHLARLRFLRGRPWLVDAIAARPAFGPQGIRLVELTLARLADHPAPGPAKLEAISVLAGMLQTQALHERRGGVLDDEFVAAQITFLQRTASDGDHPHLAAALSDQPTAPQPADDRLARILALVLDGLLPKPE